MKIKKSASTASAPAAGGAAIADRFKLDAVPAGPSAKNGTISKTAAATALAFGFVAFLIAGILTFMLYQHWDYLMQA